MDRQPFATNRRKELLLLILALLGGFYEGAGRFYWSPQTFNFDHTRQVIGAQSLLAGDGVSIGAVDPTDFSEFRSDPITAWPPGYSWALAPIIALTDDVYAAVMTLDLLLLLILFVSWWWITYQLRSTLTYWIRVGLIGWWVVVASPAWHIGPNDIFSLTCFLLGTALTLRVATNPAIMLSLLAGLAYGLAAAGRYAYWPLIVVGPAALLWVGRRRLASHSLIQGVCAGVIVAGIYLRNQLVRGQGTQEYGYDVVPGFFPEHLLDITPFPVSVMGIYGAFAPGGFLGSISASLEQAFQPLLWVVALLLAAGAIWGLRWAFREVSRGSGGTSEKQVSPLAVVHGGVTSLLTLGMLTYLSVRNPPHRYPTPDDAWVYLAETRYYVPLSMVLFVGIGWFFERARGISGRPRLVVSAVMVLIAVLATGPAALRAKRFVEIHMLDSTRPSRALAPGLPELLAAQLRLPSDASRLVYLDEDVGRREWASMRGVVVIDPRDVAMLNQDVCAGATVVLAYSVTEAPDHVRRLQEQLRALGAEETGRFGDVLFLARAP